MSLQADKISLTIGRRAILDNVTLAARAGEVTAIVGPNGSGKTSLLRAITGEYQTAGTTHLNGLLVTQANGARLAIMRGVLPQAARLAFPFKAIEVVRIGHQAGPHGVDRQLPHRALAAVGLSGFEDRFYQDLSGGEQQRVQLARVLAQVWQPVFSGQPCWLFLDEPVASLDIGHQLGIMQLARDYAQRGGGVIAVMHDLNLTAMFAHKVAIMKNGEVFARGDPQTVFTDTTLSAVYGCNLRINTKPSKDTPFVLPQAVI
ncbi:heme ABC transporter ATP-binding protein [uncultured Roseovarius sp.]|uniref:heme ABC transporter ATP-binding protein n=1 Tax=uncultured Roseovarius sp. TaxID=293344 RepID=UPI00263349FC|nr:heme ABC transporter ATP-binding protein [uncultured Roseovarius sp.]